MSEQARHLFEEALRLSVEERTELALKLMDTVDPAPDEQTEAAWAAEIERRAERVLQGKSQGKDWATVRAEIEARRRHRP